LTVTNSNRIPQILSYGPLTSNFTMNGTTATTLNATVYDPDMTNAYPSIEWYVDGVIQAGEGSDNKTFDNFSYLPGCGISGVHNITIVTSDGLLASSVSWNVTVNNIVCPPAVIEGGSGGGGGGGGAIAGYCMENWVCDNWGPCQNVDRSFSAKTLSPEDYFRLNEICAQNQYDGRFCGFQITSCQDLALCNNTIPKVPKPAEMRSCYFTENPNCIDGITNCHDGSCELLVDCGGPCGPCPTCSDEKRNQGEEGIDCGGPCPFACEAEEGFQGISFLIIGLLIVAVIVIVFILFKVFSIFRFHFFVAGKRRKKEEKKEVKKQA
jgi:hypothetical protein